MLPLLERKTDSQNKVAEEEGRIKERKSKEGVIKKGRRGEWKRDRRNKETWKLNMKTMIKKFPKNTRHGNIVKEGWGREREKTSVKSIIQALQLRCEIILLLTQGSQLMTSVSGILRLFGSVVMHVFRNWHYMPLRWNTHKCSRGSMGIWQDQGSVGSNNKTS